MRRNIVLSVVLASVSTVAMAQTDIDPKVYNNVIVNATEQWDPVPAVVTTGNFDKTVIPAPSDALVLFDGTDLSQWSSVKGGEATWDISDGVMYIADKSGSIVTKESFGDCQIHLEWMIPEGSPGTGQGRGNSGIYIQGLYEVQILDSYQNETYSNGQAGSIYKQYPPLVNACQKPGSWNVYDIIFTAPTFREDGSLKDQARLTVLHNGVLVQNNSMLIGPTEYNKIPRYKAHGKKPILLQYHNNRIAYRNIWIREL